MHTTAVPHFQDWADLPQLLSNQGSMHAVLGVELDAHQSRVLPKHGEWLLFGKRLRSREKPCVALQNFQAQERAVRRSVPLADVYAPHLSWQ